MKENRLSYIQALLLILLIASLSMLLLLYLLNPKNVEVPQNKEQMTQADLKILNLEIVDCTIHLFLTSQKRIKIGEMFNSGMENPKCLKDARHSVSESGNYAAFEDISGGIDSAIRIYSIEQINITTLDVLGTSKIQDLVFLPGDLIAVLLSSPSISDKQWITLYNIPQIYAKYKENLLNNTSLQAEKQFLIKDEYVRNLDLPDLNQDYSYLKTSTEGLLVGTESPEKFHVFNPEQYKFNEQE